MFLGIQHHSYPKPGHFEYEDRTVEPEVTISSEDCNRGLRADKPDLRRIVDEYFERHIGGGRT